MEGWTLLFSEERALKELVWGYFQGPFLGHPGLRSKPAVPLVAARRDFVHRNKLCLQSTQQKLLSTSRQLKCLLSALK